MINHRVVPEGGTGSRVVPERLSAVSGSSTPPLWGTGTTAQTPTSPRWNYSQISAQRGHTEQRSGVVPVEKMTENRLEPVGPKLGSGSINGKNDKSGTTPEAGFDEGPVWVGVDWGESSKTVVSVVRFPHPHRRATLIEQIRK